MAETDKTEEFIPDPGPVEQTIQQTAVEPSQPAPAPAKRGGFVGAVLGGLIAAVAGFGVAQYVPDGWPIADNTDLVAQVAKQAEEIAALKAQQPVDTTALQDRITALEAAEKVDPLALETSLAEIDARLDKIASLPVGDGAALKALRDEVAALKLAATPDNVQAMTALAQEQLAQAEASAAKIKADAEAMAKAAQTREALGRLQAALDSGTPYAAALAALPEVPKVLTDAADTGLPTLVVLQDGFPMAARAALDAALRANMGESWSDRVGSFLRTQTGARSLTPREGSDPDAVLSRAEAALAAGDLQTVLTELDTLPAEALPALVDWRALVEKRLAAAKAVTALTASIGE